MNWHSERASAVIDKLGSDEQAGLSEHEAKKRLEEYGENRLEDKKKVSLLRQFLSQFSDFCVIILFIACVISFVTGIIDGSRDFADPIMILTIVIMNAVIGVVQERRAERAIEALKKLSAPTAKAVRSGKFVKLPTESLVPGDIILLESGDLVPADARIISCEGLKVRESALTGEAEATLKTSAVINESECELADMKNCVFASTTVIAGSCRAVVTETGMNTKVGRIADMLKSEPAPQTPLQIRLASVGKALAVACVIICAVVFAVGVQRKSGVMNSFMLSVGLAVAAIPEGLPAIVTVVLSIGVQRLAKSNAIIRHLPAVETLGAATYICSDKTGTLTKNKMTVVRLCGVNGELQTKSEHGKRLVLFGSVCSDSRAEKRKGRLNFSGDPTETAILEAAYNSGEDVTMLEKKYPRLGVTPFTSENKKMCVVNRIGGELQLTVKGAPDVLLPLCTHYEENGRVMKFTQELRRKTTVQNETMAGEALRVIAVAYRKAASGEDKKEEELIFCGLIGMLDPPRPEAARAVGICKQAGITPVMITGDHISTACAVAEKLGIYQKGDLAMTGRDIDACGDEEFSRRVMQCRVYARVTPEHKMRIVKALRANGETVAMTGDGVNDAPALKAADIGCAMGRGGTDVAKNAADMILTDDNFATIVKAVEQGRGIYDNIKKAVHFLLGTNIGEILTIFFASILGFETPLEAIHLLWVNLVTDSLPAMALGTEKPEKGIMNRKPLPQSKGFFADGLWLDISLEGMLIGALTLLSFAVGRFILPSENPLVLGRTMAFCTLSFCEITHSLNLRSSQPILKTGLFGNKMMNIAFPVCTAAQAAVVVIPSLARMFGVVPLNFLEWVIVGAISMVPPAVGETGKILSYLARQRAERTLGKAKAEIKKGGC